MGGSYLFIYLFIHFKPDHEDPYTYTYT